MLTTSPRTRGLLFLAVCAVDYKPYKQRFGIESKADGPNSLPQTALAEIHEQIYKLVPREQDSIQALEDLLNSSGKPAGYLKLVNKVDAERVLQILRTGDDSRPEGEAERGASSQGEVMDSDDEEGEKDETMWRSEGSEYIGKRVRLKFPDSSHADGVVVGWLDKDESDFFPDGSDVPAALWRLQYDDTRIGSEHLEEYEVKEAMELLSREQDARIKASPLESLDDSECLSQTCESLDCLPDVVTCGFS